MRLPRLNVLRRRRQLPELGLLERIVRLVFVLSLAFQLLLLRVLRLSQDRIDDEGRGILAVAAHVRDLPRVVQFPDVLVTDVGKNFEDLCQTGILGGVSGNGNRQVTSLRDKERWLFFGKRRWRSYRVVRLRSV